MNRGLAINQWLWTIKVVDLFKDYYHPGKSFWMKIWINLDHLSLVSLCHPWFTATNLSYRFPILKLPPPPCPVLLVRETPSINGWFRATPTYGKTQETIIFFIKIIGFSIALSTGCICPYMEKTGELVFAAWLRTSPESPVDARWQRWGARRGKHGKGQEKPWENGGNFLEIFGICGFLRIHSGEMDKNDDCSKKKRVNYPRNVVVRWGFITEN